MFQFERRKGTNIHFKKKKDNILKRFKLFIHLWINNHSKKESLFLQKYRLKQFFLCLFEPWLDIDHWRVVECVESSNSNCCAIDTRDDAMRLTDWRRSQWASCRKDATLRPADVTARMHRRDALLWSDTVQVVQHKHRIIRV